jgi:hypothetical protein
MNLFMLPFGHLHNMWQYIVIHIKNNKNQKNPTPTLDPSPIEK